MRNGERALQGALWQDNAYTLLAKPTRQQILCWTLATSNTIGEKLHITEMMMRWAVGVTMLWCIQNNYICCSFQIGPTTGKLEKANWDGMAKSWNGYPITQLEMCFQQKHAVDHNSFGWKLLIRISKMSKWQPILSRTEFSNDTILGELTSNMIIWSSETILILTRISITIWSFIYFNIWMWHINE